MDYIDRFLKNFDEKDLDKLHEKLLDKRPLSEIMASRDELTGLSILADYTERAHDLVKNAGKVSGLKTGYDSIDDLTKGLKGGDLIVLAGQPSHGKTLIGNNIAYRMAKRGDPVLFVTLEMTKEKVTARFMQIAEADNTDPNELQIFYQEVDWLGAPELPLLIKKAITEAGCKTVIIDHLHFLADREARDMRMEIGNITKKMKRAAVELNVPIILLAQVKRLDDPKRKPQNHDLKESGYIEQDADIILMVWRDIAVDSQDTNAVEVYCTKNRDEGFTEDRVKYLYQKASTLHDNMFSKSIVDPFSS
jgi:replicative DNA helicase